MVDDIENYTTERTIAFFAIGDEHYVAKDLSRAIAADFESKVKRIEELEAQCEALQNKCANRGLSPEDSDALEAENERLRAALNQAYGEQANHGYNSRETFELMGAALQDKDDG